nr:unnamed protein product [Callosobruchus analis]
MDRLLVVQNETSGIPSLADSVESYITTDFRRLSSHFPGTDIEQVIADIQAIAGDLEYLLDLGRSRYVLEANKTKVRVQELLLDTRETFEHLKEVVEQPDSSFAKIEATLGQIIELAKPLNPDKVDFHFFVKNDVRELIHAVQSYLQMIAEQITSPNVEIPPGEGADEYRGLITKMVDIFGPLREADRLLWEMSQNVNDSLSMVEVKQIFDKVRQEFLVVAEPVTQVKVHRAIPKEGIVDVKETLEDALAFFLQTIERSVNWPLTKTNVVKIPDYISLVIAAIMNKFPLQLYVSPNLKVDRVVEQIAGKLKVLARTILALVKHGKDGTFLPDDMIEVLQHIQEIGKSIHADLQKLHSIDADVLDANEMTKFNSALQELSDEVKRVLKQAGMSNLPKFDLHQLIWKAERLYIYTAESVYGPISRESGLMYQDLFER